MGEKGNYETEKEVKIRDIDSNGEKNQEEEKYMIRSFIKVKPSWFYHVDSVFLQQ